MTQEGWRELVLDTITKHQAGDSYALDLLAQLLYEQDAAKQVLREKGYGCTGMPWKETVEEIPQHA